MRTFLYDSHIKLEAKMAEWNGFEMPLHYQKGIIHEHLAVRKSVSLFDVSHMGWISVSGADAEQLLDYLSTNRIAGRRDFTAAYTVWTNPTGGCIDDLLIFRENSETFYVMTGGGSRTRDLAHLQEYAQAMDVMIEPHFERGILSLQGPHSPMLLAQFFPETARLQYMHFLKTQYKHAPVILSRTGYTGSVGFEIIGQPETLTELWDLLLKEGKPYGIEPAGMGARDTLRLEMGYPHWGEELQETIAPTETLAAWAVRWAKPDFLGREALEILESDPHKRHQYGVVLQGKSVARSGCEVFYEGESIGVVTSGNFSPILNQAIAIIMVDRELATNDSLVIDVRQQAIEATVVDLPFVPIDCKQIEKMVRDRQFWIRGIKSVYFAAPRLQKPDLVAGMKQTIIDLGYQIVNDGNAAWEMGLLSEGEDLLLEKLDEAAFIVVECSLEDTGLGRIIEYGKSKGLFGKRPAKVICVYQKDREPELSPLIKGMALGKYPHVQVGSYTDAQDGKQILAQFLES